MELAEKEERVRSVLIIQRITSEYPQNKVEFYSIQKRLRSLQLTVATSGQAGDRGCRRPAIGWPQLTLGLKIVPRLREV